jgi:hypothetical protein
LIDEYPLRGFSPKIARARTHLQALKDAYGAFCDREPLTVSVQYEDREYPTTITEESGKQRVVNTTHEYAVFRLQVNENPPLNWSLIIGDCLQNTRAALEHIAWCLAYPQYGGSGPTRGTSFPMLDRQPHRWRPIEGIGDAANEVIALLQPYQRGADARLDPLWILNELARVDRHQVLHVVAATVGRAGISLTDSPPGTPGGGAHIAPAYIDDELYEALSRGDQQLSLPKDGTEMASAYTSFLWPPRRRRTIELNTSYFIAFTESEAKITTGLPVIETLERILRHIETEVLPRFMRFLDAAP